VSNLHPKRLQLKAGDIVLLHGLTLHAGDIGEAGKAAARMHFYIVPQGTSLAIDDDRSSSEGTPGSAEEESAEDGSSEGSDDESEEEEEPTSSGMDVDGSDSGTSQGGSGSSGPAGSSASDDSQNAVTANATHTLHVWSQALQRAFQQRFGAWQ